MKMLLPNSADLPWHTTSSLIVNAAALLFIVIFALYWKRRQTRAWLESCGLPTVFWRPRFVNYDEEKKQLLASSSITGILPRMQRLDGPYQMYGTVYGISTAVVHIAHPVPAKQVLSTSPTKSPAYNHFKNFSGNGVFTADGEEWREKRASVLHCLIRQNGTTTIEQETNRAASSLLSDLEQSLLQQNNGIVDNIVLLLQRATIGLIYRYITHDNDMDTRLYHTNDNNRESRVTKPPSRSSSSSSLTSLGEPTTTTAAEEKEMQNDNDKKKKASATPQHSILNGGTNNEKQKDTTISSLLLALYLTSVTQIRMIILAQSRSIWFLVPRWFYQYFSNMYRQEERTMGPIREFATQACRRAAKPNSPLAMLQTKPSHADVDGTPNNNTIPKPLLDEAITILFAGQDTSAATLSWTLHLLSLYPDIQKRLYEEIKSALKDAEESELSKRTVMKMPFLDAVLKESMRLYPVAPFVVRRLTRDIVVAESDKKTTRLPNGVLACVWIYSLHRNPKLWSRPNDFCPERWLDKQDEGMSSGAYMPFAAGPRNCVGQPLANIMLRILLVRLLEKYEFTDPAWKAGVDPKLLLKDMQAGFTVLPAGGVRLAVRKRS